MDADEPVKKGQLEAGERRVITINRRSGYRGLGSPGERGLTSHWRNDAASLGTAKERIGQLPAGSWDLSRRVRGTPLMASSCLG